MHILSVSGDLLFLQNIDAFPAITLRNGYIGFPNGGQYVVVDTDQEALKSRFEDIVEALASGEVRVYDTREKVGYWKPKPKPARSHAKKPAPAPASDAKK